MKIPYCVECRILISKDLAERHQDHEIMDISKAPELLALLKEANTGMTQIAFHDWQKRTDALLKSIS